MPGVDEEELYRSSSQDLAYIRFFLPELEERNGAGTQTNPPAALETTKKRKIDDLGKEPESVAPSTNAMSTSMHTDQPMPAVRSVRVSWELMSSRYRVYFREPGAKDYDRIDVSVRQNGNDRNEAKKKADDIAAKLRAGVPIDQVRQEAAVHHITPNVPQWDEEGNKWRISAKDPSGTRLRTDVGLRKFGGPRDPAAKGKAEEEAKRILGQVHAGTYKKSQKKAAEYQSRMPNVCWSGFGGRWKVRVIESDNKKKFSYFYAKEYGNPVEDYKKCVTAARKAAEAYAAQIAA